MNRAYISIFIFLLIIATIFFSSFLLYKIQDALTLVTNDIIATASFIPAAHTIEKIHLLNNIWEGNEWFLVVLTGRNKTEAIKNALEQSKVFIATEEPHDLIHNLVDFNAILQANLADEAPLFGLRT